MKRPPANWATTTNARRKRKMLTVTLSEEARERLDELVEERGQSRGEVLDALILAAK